MLRQLIKKTFNTMGYTVVRINKRNGPSLRTPLRNTMQEALEHIKSLGYYPSLVIDVGTASGTYDLLNVYPKTEYLWIEPLTEFEDKLKELAKKFTGKYLLCAAGNVNGKIEINVHDDLSGSSILHENDGVDADGLKREVDINKLDDLVNANSYKNILLKIDVQGAELDVLEGSANTLINTDVVILEVSFFNFMKDSPDFYSIINYMKGKHFVAYDIFNGHNRLLDGALAQKDILFVKENGIFRKNHCWSTPEQRKAYLESFLH